jgi:hypothetical protein
MNKVHIKLIDKATGETCEIYNDIFNRDNGVAFYQIDKNWDLVYVRRFAGQKDKNGKEIYEGDKLGIKLCDDEWTTIVRDYFGTLIVDVEGLDYGTTALSFLDEDCEVEVLLNTFEKR